MVVAVVSVVDVEAAAVVMVVAAAAAVAAAAVRATKALQVQHSKKRPYVSACGLFLFNATNLAAF